MKRKPNFPNFPPVADIPEGERLLRPREVAELLSVSMGTIRGWRSRNPRTGEGPEFIRVGGLRVRYSLRALREYLSERTVRGCSKG